MIHFFARSSPDKMMHREKGGEVGDQAEDYGPGREANSGIVFSCSHPFLYNLHCGP